MLGLPEAREQFLRLQHERSLRDVAAKRLVLARHGVANVERDGPRGGHRSRSSWNEEVCGQHEEPLRMVKRAELRIAFGRRRPMKRRAGEGRDHAVIRMGIDRAIRTEGQDNIGLEFAHLRDESASGCREVRELQLGVLIVPDLMMADAEHLAGGVELRAAHACELLWRPGITAI